MVTSPGVHGWPGAVLAVATSPNPSKVSKVHFIANDEIREAEVIVPKVKIQRKAFLARMVI